MATRPVTVNDVLDGHVALDLACFDRIYLNDYVPNLQVGGQVVNFLTHRGFPIPSPALRVNGLFLVFGPVLLLAASRSVRDWQPTSTPMIGVST